MPHDDQGQECSSWMYVGANWRLVKTQVTGPHPREADSEGLRWGLGTCIPTHSQGPLMLLVPRPWEPLIVAPSCLSILEYKKCRWAGCPILLPGTRDQIWTWIPKTSSAVLPCSSVTSGKPQNLWAPKLLLPKAVLAGQSLSTLKGLLCLWGRVGKRYRVSPQPERY